MASSYYIRAIWDAEANALSEFESLVQELAPQMLAANVKDDVHGAPLLFTAERQMAIA